MKIKLYIIKLILLLVSFSYSNTGAFSISRIHYDGGGDWYAKILVESCSEDISSEKKAIVDFLPSS